MGGLLFYQHYISIEKYFADIDYILIKLVCIWLYIYGYIYIYVYIYIDR